MYVLDKNNEQEYILENKIIFIFLGLEDYIIEEEDETGYNKEYISHATSLIVWPISKMTYGIYHFNPHGNYSSDICYFEKYITKYRKKEIHLDIPVDVWIIKKIKEELNKEIKLQNPISQLQVKYNNTSTYNYYGPNLQVADSYGLCFLYPVLLFKFICLNENACHILNASNGSLRRLPSTNRLIIRGNWNILIHLCLIEAIEEYKSKVQCHNIQYTQIVNMLYMHDRIKEKEFIEIYELFLKKNKMYITKAFLYSFIKTFIN